MAELRTYVEWLKDELLGPRLSRNVDIVLSFQETLEKGSCKTYQSSRPRKFFITIHPGLGRIASMRTLAHEMVHVKQWTKGEMQNYHRHDLTRWKKRYINEESVKYRALPWEREAFRKESGLYRKFQTSKGVTNKK